MLSDAALQVPRENETTPLSYLKSRKRSRKFEARDSPLPSNKSRRSAATPAHDEGSPGAPFLDGMSPNRHKKFVGLILTVWNDISTHRNGALFNNPVSDRDAPGYSSLIKTPQDLKTIRQKVRDGVITNAKEFERDILLMFANSIMFNEEGTDMSNMAQEMRAEAEKLVRSFIQTEKRVVRSSN
ncbi:Bromodomain-containing protein 8 [Neolecta irregularis DAH-3]|uniref:Bromodomain-containing protein 8 n=1 Tax=Neolecta irregularis (strain DAH-3) TaxID=1198029 RepID=A0A1U7LGH7_NEOID|nr:Bromodomain-containing protein 8 [Neolecta irregularis DAH-3]|eukprot:OLL21728.1 Bromodomain-containing protein 8 [Neolecta irregularis DAH-3]